MGMRTLFAALAVAAASLVAAEAQAEQRIFIIANTGDGYGVDRCLATGATCGSPIAAAYCRAHDYSEARWFRKVDPADITGAVPASASTCPGEGCDDVVAIACTK